MIKKSVANIIFALIYALYSCLNGNRFQEMDYRCNYHHINHN